ARKNILPPSPTLISVTSSKDEEDGRTPKYDLGMFFVPEPPAESPFTMQYPGQTVPTLS
ncbi:hypothetical protein V5O48_017772, partial [Marasmius crinis-equi]